MAVTSGVDHVAIRVSDMERSLFFYRDLLGWEVVMDLRLDGPGMEAALRAPGVRVHNVMLRKDPLGMIELVQVHAPEVRPYDGTRRPLDVGGLFTLSLNVEDIDACYEELTAKGVEFHSAPATIEVPGLGTTRIVFLSDPDGVAIELVQAEGTSLNK
ncbi:VOC family protein [Saccharothrix sp. BKS2]|uniref:VOC family protein n=1 Tax=Saccharothrix sp. BKS2 TaxID=3064400 RepID=UPI0039E79059